ncbi:MAG: hypothetical protein WC761_02130 [Candidatus Paceibacterota bacterium]|jgi:hypothetical protein
MNEQKLEVGKLYEIGMHPHNHYSVWYTIKSGMINTLQPLEAGEIILFTGYTASYQVTSLRWRVDANFLSGTGVVCHGIVGYKSSDFQKTEMPDGALADIANHPFWSDMITKSGLDLRKI